MYWEDKKYIVDDRPREMSPEIAAMTDEEAEAEFQRRFGEALKRLEAKMDGFSEK